MNNKDKLKKEMKSIKPARGLVDDTINMIKNNEKKSFWLTYKKPVVAFACSFVVLASAFGVYTYQNSSTVFQKTIVNDKKASKYISVEDSDKNFAEFLEVSGLSKINKADDSDLIITYKGKGLRTNEFYAYENTMRLVKYINRKKYISYFRSKDVFTEEQAYKYIGVNLDDWIILNVNNKYKICIPDTVEAFVVVIDLKAKDFTFYKLYINSSVEDNKEFLNLIRLNLVDTYNSSSNDYSNNVEENKTEENNNNEVNNNSTEITTNTENNNSNSDTTNNNNNTVYYYYGDINRDGIINSRDVSLIRRYVAGNSGHGFDAVQNKLADVNGDGEITGMDATLVQYASIKAIDFDGKTQLKNATLYGDVSKSGYIEQADYDILDKYLAGSYELDAVERRNADVNRDGKIDKLDLVLIEGLVKKYFTNDLLSPMTNYTLYGDVDMNGIVNSRDASTVTRYVKDMIGLDEQQIKNADVNADGKVDDTDRELIQEFVVKMHDDTLPFKPIK